MVWVPKIYYSGGTVKGAKGNVERFSRVIQRTIAIDRRTSTGRYGANSGQCEGSVNRRQEWLAGRLCERVEDVIHSEMAWCQSNLFLCAPFARPIAIRLPESHWIQVHDESSIASLSSGCARTVVSKVDAALTICRAVTFSWSQCVGVRYGVETRRTIQLHGSKDTEFGS